MQESQSIHKNVAKQRMQLAMLFTLFVLLLPTTARTGELEDCRSLLWSGEYESAIKIAKEKVEAKTWNEGWSRILIEAITARVARCDLN